MEKMEIYEQQFISITQKYKNARNLNPKKAYKHLVEELKQEIQFFQMDKLILEKRIEYENDNSIQFMYQGEIFQIEIYLECLMQISKIVKEYGKIFKRKTIENILVLKIILELIEENYKKDKSEENREIENAKKEGNNNTTRNNESILQNALELQKFIKLKLREYVVFIPFNESFSQSKSSPSRS